MLKLYLGLIAISFIGGLVYHSYNLQHKLELANQNVAKLETVAESSQATIASLKSDLVIQNKLSLELSEKLLQAQTQKTALLQKLQRHDLAKLSLAKPKLVEDRVNAATAKVFRDLEQLTTD